MGGGRGRRTSSYREAVANDELERKSRSEAQVKDGRCMSRTEAQGCGIPAALVVTGALLQACATGSIATRAPFWTVELSCTPAQTGASSLEALVTYALVTTAPSHKHLVLICRAVARCQVTIFLVACIRHRPRSTRAYVWARSVIVPVGPSSGPLYVLPSP